MTGLKKNSRDSERKGCKVVYLALDEMAIKSQLGMEI